MRPRRLKKHREKTADGGRRRLPDYCRRARAQACRQQTGARVGSHCRRARARLCGRCQRVCGNSPACASAPVRKQPRVRARAFAETAPPARARRCGNSPACARAPLRKQPRVRARAFADAADVCARAFADAAEITSPQNHMTN